MENNVAVKICSDSMNMVENLFGWLSRIHSDSGALPRFSLLQCGSDQVIYLASVISLFGTHVAAFGVALDATTINVGHHIAYW